MYGPYGHTLPRSSKRIIAFCAIPNLMSMKIRKLMRQVSPEPNSGCWLWLGYADRNGYGIFNEKANQERFCAQDRLGNDYGPVPVCLELTINVRMPGCVNPDHLV